MLKQGRFMEQHFTLRLCLQFIIIIQALESTRLKVKVVQLQLKDTMISHFNSRSFTL